MADSEVITVILGAGASFDVDDGFGPTRSFWRPPLASELFDTLGRASFGEIAAQLSGLHLLGPQLHREATKDGGDLEAALQRCARDRDPTRRRFYLDVPSYLQAIISGASRNYLTRKTAGNFLPLVDQLFCDGCAREVVFLTLNYDDYLEQALAAIGMPIRSLADYTKAERPFRLVKLHGSIDWFYDLAYSYAKDDRDRPHDRPSALKVMLQRDGWTKHLMFDRQDLAFQSAQTLYPALTAPLAAKTRDMIVCPEFQQRAGLELLRRSKRTLVIGTSMKDQTLAEFLRELPPQTMVDVVTGENERDQKGLLDRAAACVRTCERSAMQLFTCGFGQYVNGPHFGEFLTGRRAEPARVPHR